MAEVFRRCLDGVVSNPSSLENLLAVLFLMGEADGAWPILRSQENIAHFAVRKGCAYPPACLESDDELLLAYQQLQGLLLLLLLLSRGRVIRLY